MKAVHLGLILFVLTNLSISARQPNILFIAIDDMNDWTGFLGGHPQVKTPNMDALAAKGVNFTNAHCIAPACSPSRNALLFGVEPFHSGFYPFYKLENVPSKVMSKYTSLPTFLKQNGYNTYGAGKIHHGFAPTDAEWTNFHKKKGAKLVYQPEKGYQQGDNVKMAFCPTSNPLPEHPDHQVADYGIDVLNQSHEKPFFLGVGIVKPHLAFVCPEQFFDLYPETVAAPEIKPDDFDDIPWAARANAKLRDEVEFRKDDNWNKVRRAYLACISWADYNVGRVLDALEKSEYADNTVVVLWSDHGYHLGEKRSFRKFSLWEEATRVPFIIRDPRPDSGAKSGDCNEAVSLIHVYRTICDFAGLTPPEYVDGFSLVSQLREPQKEIPTPAITTWGRGNYTVRSDLWRYTRYFDGSEELYHNAEDPNEWTNLAANPEYAETKKRFAKHLPKDEAPLVKEGVDLWNSVDADKPSLRKIKNTWKSANKELQPPLGD